MAPNSQQTQQFIEEFLQNPDMVIVVFFYVSLLVPVVEELLKPLGIFLFNGRRITPGQGFVLGMTAGGFLASSKAC